MCGFAVGYVPNYFLPGNQKRSQEIVWHTTPLQNHKLGFLHFLLRLIKQDIRSSEL